MLFVEARFLSLFVCCVLVGVCRVLLSCVVCWCCFGELWSVSCLLFIVSCLLFIVFGRCCLLPVVGDCLMCVICLTQLVGCCLFVRFFFLKCALLLLLCVVVGCCVMLVVDWHCLFVVVC